MHTPLLHILGTWDGASVPRLVGSGTSGDLRWSKRIAVLRPDGTEEMCWAGGILSGQRAATLALAPHGKGQLSQLWQIHRQIHRPPFVYRSYSLCQQHGQRTTNEEDRNLLQPCWRCLAKNLTSIAPFEESSFRSTRHSFPGTLSERFRGML